MGKVGCFYLAVGFLPARLGPQPSRWRQAVSWRLCRLETARALRALRRLTDRAWPLRGKPFFLLWEKWDVFILQLVFCLPGWGVHLAGETAFSFVGKVVYFYLAVGFFACPAGDCFSACPAGAKTTFSFACKRKSGSGLRKRKDRPVEIMGRYDTTGRWICAVMVSLG